MKKICKLCKKEFEFISTGINHHRKLCVECQKPREKKPHLEVNCKICNNKFIQKAKNHITCSNKCRDNNRLIVSKQNLSKEKIKNYFKRSQLKKYKENKSRYKHYYKEFCPYCRQDLENYEIDHIIPKNNGGTDISCNLIKVCFSCNNSKRDTDLLVWAKKQNYPLTYDLIRIYKYNYKLHVIINLKIKEFYEKFK